MPKLGRRDGSRVSIDVVGRVFDALVHVQSCIYMYMGVADMYPVFFAH